MKPGAARNLPPLFHSLAGCQSSRPANRRL